MDHEDARKRKTGGKILGFFYWFYVILFKDGKWIAAILKENNIFKLKFNKIKFAEFENFGN